MKNESFCSEYDSGSIGASDTIEEVSFSEKADDRTGWQRKGSEAISLLAWVQNGQRSGVFSDFFRSKGGGR